MTSIGMFTIKTLTAVFWLLTLLLSVTSNKPPVLINFNSVIIAPEDTPVGSKLTELCVSDTDGPSQVTFKTADNETRHFLRVENQGLRNTYWCVDVLLTASLDRDYHPNTIHVLFKVRDGINEIPVRMSLFIADVNDERPTFINLPHRIHVSEDVTVGWQVYTVSATDPDTGTGGIVKYSLQTPYGPNEQPFNIHPITGVIMVKEKLDFEKRTFYKVLVNATDGGGLASQSELVVMVTDVPDSPPVFDRLYYMEQVPENAPIGTSITTITAHDGDLGISSPVSVSIEQEGICSTLFAIDQSSGTLSVTRSLNRENNDLNKYNGACNITLKATEYSTLFGNSSSTTYVIILITDINDHHPTFNEATFTGEVLRTTEVGMPIVMSQPIIVVDKDMGINGAMEFYLESMNGKHDAIFDIEPKMAFSHAQLYLNVLNSTALRNYKHEQISVGVVARESKTQRRHSNMAAVHIKIRNQITDICNHGTRLGYKTGPFTGWMYYTTACSTVGKLTQTPETQSNSEYTT